MIFNLFSQNVSHIRSLTLVMKCWAIIIRISTCLFCYTIIICCSLKREHFWHDLSFHKLDVKDKRGMKECCKTKPVLYITNKQQSCSYVLEQPQNHSQNHTYTHTYTYLCKQIGMLGMLSYFSFRL